MWQRIKASMEKFLRGRYGVDILNKYLLGLALVFIFVGIFVPYANFISIGILIYCYFRIFSKNVTKRGVENYKFVIWKNKLFKPFKNLKLTILGDKSSKYYKCPKCKQIIRVPRKKGKIQIRCPKCGCEFIKNT